MSRKVVDYRPLYCTEKCHIVTLTGLETSKGVTPRSCNSHLCYVSTCAFCLKEFHSDRPHTKTCSGTCRTALCRLNKRPNHIAPKSTGLKQARMRGV